MDLLAYRNMHGAVSDRSGRTTLMTRHPELINLQDIVTIYQQSTKVYQNVTICYKNDIACEKLQKCKKVQSVVLKIYDVIKFHKKNRFVYKML